MVKGKDDTTPELALSFQRITPRQREDLEFDRFNVHRPPLHGMSLVSPGTKSATLHPQVRDHTTRPLDVKNVSTVRVTCKDVTWINALGCFSLLICK
ncbi:hypothetical protein TNCV_3098841 [Trichonephila clavipes]|nr:hypothetical protein TNCV_3098841 [Trichonephila clavipes]